MATITTEEYLDSGTARTAGEAWTINGGKLIIRTDTRWHAGAPASMTGTLAAVTVSGTLGGEVVIDGTKVRWLAYSGGSGNVPAIGTSITQGGISGYLLGVWATLTSAPTTPGSAMPSSGFIKFREVTGGQFSSGSLTGIGASALGADVPGWIEIVQREAVANTIPRLGRYEIDGDWFEIGVTNGSAGQTMQVPTNGGGANTHVPGVWVETAPASGVYERWSALTSAVGFIAANVATDARSRLLESVGNGVVRFGHDGTNPCGWTPPAGCRVRVPNVFLRASTAAGGDANNRPPHATPGTRPDFGVTGQGELSIRKCMGDWYLSLTGAYSLTLEDVAVFDRVDAISVVEPVTITNLIIGGYTIVSGGQGLDVTYCQSGGTISGFSTVRVNSSSNNALMVQYTLDFVIEDVEMAFPTYARVVTAAVRVEYSSNVVVDGVKSIGGIAVAGSVITKCRFRNLDYTDRLVGDTVAPNALSSVSISHGSDIIVDGITFGRSGLIANQTPYTSICYASGDISNLHVRNIGTPDDPVVCTPAALPTFLAYNLGILRDFTLKRAYISSTRSGIASLATTQRNTRYENVRLETAPVAQPLGGNEVSFRGTRVGGLALPVIVSTISTVGNHSSDWFLSDTDGMLAFYMAEPTTFTNHLVETTFGATSGFSGTGLVTLPELNDSITIDFGYSPLGHTGFSTDHAAYIGTASGNSQNYHYEVSIDGGAWQPALYVTRKNAGTTNAGNTVLTVQDGTDGIQVGDYITTQARTQIAPGTTVAAVDSTTITLSNPLVINLGGNSPLLVSPKSFVETPIDPAVGLRLKLRVTTKTANPANSLSMVGFSTTSSALAQKNEYPLNTVKLTFTNLMEGVEVVLFDADGTEIGRRSVPISGVVEFSGDSDDDSVTGYSALLWKDNLIPFKMTSLIMSVDNPTYSATLVSDDLYDEDATEKSTFIPGSKLQVLNSGVSTVTIQQLYSDWKRWVRESDHGKYDFAYRQLGGDSISAEAEVPYYAFLQNGWKIRPQEANHKLTVSDGVLVSEDGSDPFVNTTGAFNVRVVYSQPVQAITVNTAGGSGLTPEQEADLAKIKRNTNLIPTLL